MPIKRTVAQDAQTFFNEAFPHRVKIIFGLISALVKNFLSRDPSLDFCCQKECRQKCKSLFSNGYYKKRAQSF